MLLFWMAAASASQIATASRVIPLPLLPWGSLLDIPLQPDTRASPRPILFVCHLCTDPEAQCDQECCLRILQKPCLTILPGLG